MLKISEDTKLDFTPKLFNHRQDRLQPPLDFLLGEMFQHDKNQILGKKCASKDMDFTSHTYFILYINRYVIVSKVGFAYQKPRNLQILSKRHFRKARIINHPSKPKQQRILVANACGKESLRCKTKHALTLTRFAECDCVKGIQNIISAYMSCNHTYSMTHYQQQHHQQEQHNRKHQKHE